jgi:hypothetical protein
VTIRAIAGLLCLNGAFAVMGTTVVWALRGFAVWTDVLRLVGLGYLVGVAAFGVVWTQLLVVGVPFGGWAIVLSVLAGTILAIVVGIRLARPYPTRLGSGSRSTTASLLVTATGVALVGLLLEALFRSARLQSLQAFDAWAFWVPKAKAIYFFGGLDEQIFTTTANPTYPPLLPILDAAAFHAMGSADTITFHLEFWFLVTGAVVAIAGCLHRHVPAWLLWPPLVLVMVVPRFSGRLLTPQADILVDVLFAVGALLLLLWLRDRRAWRLGAVTVLLAGATLTKREGLFFAATALAVTFVATWATRRTSWLPLAVVTGVVVAAAVPWRLWYRSHGLSGEVPSDLGLGASLDRALDSLRLSVDVLFETSLWSVIPFVLLIALAACAVWGDRRLAATLASVVALLFLGGAWVTYSYTELPITAVEALNPIVRYTGVIVVLAAVAIPLLLSSAWRGPVGEGR